MDRHLNRLSGLDGTDSAAWPLHGAERGPLRTAAEWPRLHGRYGLMRAAGLVLYGLYGLMRAAGWSRLHGLYGLMCPADWLARAAAPAPPAHTCLHHGMERTTRPTIPERSATCVSRRAQAVGAGARWTVRVGIALSPFWFTAAPCSQPFRLEKAPPVTPAFALRKLRLAS